jgi:hypothetical protein
MPLVMIKTGMAGADGQEVVLKEYLCDWPNCANVAEEVVGIVREIGQACVMCGEHATRMRRPKSDH